jgi:hypothetical protein
MEVEGDVVVPVIPPGEDVAIYDTAPLTDENPTVAVVVVGEEAVTFVGAEMEVVTELEAVEGEDVAFVPTATTVNV